MKIIRNTYPQYDGVPHAKNGDIAKWELSRGAYRLIRLSDNKTLFVTAPVNADGRLRSNGRQPPLTGIVGQVKSKGWFLEIEE